MTALIVSLLILMSLAGLGRPLAERLGAGLGAGERLALAPLLGALPLAALVQAVGYWRYDFLSMCVALLPGLLLAVRLPWRTMPRPFWSFWPWGGLLAAVLGLSVLSALAPPMDHDTIRYHLTLPRRDLELGHIWPWFGGSIYEFFPPLASLLTRLAYALGDASAAQMLNVVWMGLAALWAALLAGRLGGGHQAMLGAALLLVAQRISLNLGPAVTVDYPLAAFVGAAVTLAVAAPLRSRRALALGLLLGSAMACKYQGGVAAVAVLLPLAGVALARRQILWPWFLAGSTAALVLLPILVRNWAITGNPVFPVAHPLFVADGLDVFAPFTQAMTRQNIPGGIWGLPWSMFILQDKFDGLQWGYPFFMLGLPFAIAGKDRLGLMVAAIVGLYVVLWWLTMPHLLRFLLPVLVLLAALAAVGLEKVAAAKVGWFRPVLVATFGVAISIQALFAGSSALYRLPILLGQVSVQQALEVPAFRYYSQVSPCLWLDRNLRDGERYVALINDPSYFCPQSSALHSLRPGEAALFYSRSGAPPLSAAEAAQWFRQENVRYVVWVSNLGADDERFAFAKHRFDQLVAPLLASQPPLLDSASGRVYAAEPVIAALEQASRQPPRPADP